VSVLREVRTRRGRRRRLGEAAAATAGSAAAPAELETAARIATAAAKASSSAVARGGAALAGLALCGCAGEATPTQVMVFVDADPVVRERTAALEVHVLGGPRGEALREALSDVLRTSEGQLRWAVPVAVLPAGGDPARTFEVHAVARDGAGAALVEGRVRGGFVADELRTASVQLSMDCQAVRCGADQTCAAGRCVDAYVPPDAMPRWTPGEAPPAPVTSPDGGAPRPLDGATDSDAGAGSDAGPGSDAGTRPGTVAQGDPCRADADCAGSPVPGPWSTCSGFLNACDTTGTQARTTMAPTCLTGRCAMTSVVETQGCTREVADGIACATGRICCAGACLASGEPGYCR
jgi:hypothetical protein